MTPRRKIIERKCGEVVDWIAAELRRTGHEVRTRADRIGGWQPLEVDGERVPLRIAERGYRINHVMGTEHGSGLLYAYLERAGLRGGGKMFPPSKTRKATHGLDVAAICDRIGAYVTAKKQIDASDQEAREARSKAEAARGRLQKEFPAPFALVEATEHGLRFTAYVREETARDLLRVLREHGGPEE